MRDVTTRHTDMGYGRNEQAGFEGNVINLCAIYNKVRFVVPKDQHSLCFCLGNHSKQLNSKR